MLNFRYFEQMQKLFKELDDEQFEVILKSSYPFKKMIFEYQSALLEVETKLKVLNMEFSVGKEDNPIELIKTRIKTPLSIIRKIKKRNIKLDKHEIEEGIFDIAGIRVICPFIDDVYKIVDSLKKQFDLKIFEEKDYIKNPKPNGYRSLHLIVEVPVFLYEKMIYRKVEIQFRTIAMDFWATTEHSIRYKKNIDNTERIQKMLYDCANLSADLDNRMRLIKSLVRENKGDISGDNN